MKTQATRKAMDFFRTAKRSLIYLYCRWQDEKGHENIDTYMLSLSKLADEVGVILQAMTKRPFGVKFAVGKKVFHAFIKDGCYGYKRIA